MEQTLDIKTLGQNVRRLRRGADLTQEQLGGLIGTSYKTVINIERGRHVPKLGTFVRLAGVLDVPMENLLEEENGSHR